MPRQPMLSNPLMSRSQRFGVYLVDVESAAEVPHAAVAAAVGSLPSTAAAARTLAERLRRFHGFMLLPMQPAPLHCENDSFLESTNEIVVTTVGCKCTCGLWRVSKWK